MSGWAIAGLIGMIALCISAFGGFIFMMLEDRFRWAGPLSIALAIGVVPAFILLIVGGIGTGIHNGNKCDDLGGRMIDNNCYREPLVEIDLNSK